MADLIIFNLVIPCTDNSTGIVHSPEKLDEWLIETVDKFGGASVVGVGLRGLWYDEGLAREAGPVEDHNNWYKVGVVPELVEALRRHAAEAAVRFGQKCIYFERAGEADFIWAKVDK